MIHIDLFQHPEQLVMAKEYMAKMQIQIRLVEAFDRSYGILMSNKTIGSSNGLNRCRPFVNAVNDENEKSFSTEVGKLSLEELTFASITFDETRLKILKNSFRALHVRAYMRARKISGVNPQIVQRLRFYNKDDGSQFGLLFESASRRHELGLETCQSREKEPSTSALVDPHSFSWGGGLWMSCATLSTVTECIGSDTARSLPQQSDWTTNVSMKGSRADRADAVLCIEVDGEEILHKFFDGDGVGVSIDKLHQTLAPLTEQAMDQSQLRTWEKQHGYIDRTNCVKLGYVLQILVKSPDETSMQDLGNNLFLHTGFTEQW